MQLWQLHLFLLRAVYRAASSGHVCGFERVRCQCEEVPQCGTSSRTYVLLVDWLTVRKRVARRWCVRREVFFLSLFLCSFTLLLSHTQRLASKSVRVPTLLQRVLAVGGGVFKGLMTFSMLET